MLPANTLLWQAIVHRLDLKAVEHPQPQLEHKAQCPVFFLAATTPPR